jgi:ammonium transporter Rh
MALDRKFHFSVAALCVQAVILVLFAAFVRYEDGLGEGDLQSQNCNAHSNNQTGCESLSYCTYDVGIAQCRTTSDGHVDTYYHFYTHVHVMIFVGFGFLMTFLGRYGFSAIGFTFFLACIGFQWSIFTNTFWHRIFEEKPGDEMIKINVVNLITSDFAAAAVLIAYGAVIGKTTPTQLLVMAVCQLFFYSLNEAVGVIKLEAVDMGGSMYVHTFGAYFGLAASRMLGNTFKRRGKSAIPWADYKLNSSTKVSDLFAMIGTIFLFIYWPSFNGALAPGASQHRVVINTVISLTFSGMSTFIFSKLLRPGRKFNMVDIQNATLAGGVAVGSSADLVIEPWGAATIGFVAGLLSVVGYVYISDLLDKRFRIHDTAGVHNLHGMPGILGGIGGAISASLANDTEYGLAIGEIFPARGGDTPRSAAYQAGYQMAALVVTLLVAIVGGAVTGWIMAKFPSPAKPYDDSEHWDEEEEEMETGSSKGSSRDLLVSSYVTERTVQIAAV